MFNEEFPSWPDGELGDALGRILAANSIRYRLRTILIDMQKGYLVGDNWYSSEEEAKNAIDQSYELLGQNINVKPSFQCEVSIVHSDGSETIVKGDIEQQYREGKSPYIQYHNSQNKQQ